MLLNTSASVISFAKQLETDSAEFYQKMTEICPEEREKLLGFVKENNKYSTMVERSYYSVITDAIEGCFAFSVETDKYVFAKEAAGGSSPASAVEQAIDMERKMLSFYNDAAEQSRALMADVPRTFLIVAKKRKTREETLRALLKEK